MGKKIAMTIGFIGVIMLLLGIAGIIFENSKVRKLVTVNDVFNKIVDSSIYKTLKENGLNVKLNVSNIEFTYEDYSFEIKENNSILSADNETELDKLLFALVYDTLGSLYDYNEGDLYYTVLSNTNYKIEDGIVIGDILQIDINKKPIKLKNTDTNLIINEIKYVLEKMKNNEIQSFIKEANEYNKNYEAANGSLLMNYEITLEELMVTGPVSCDKLYFDEFGEIAFENCSFEKGKYHYYHGNLVENTNENPIKEAAELTIDTYAKAIEIAQNQFYLTNMVYPQTFDEISSIIIYDGEIPTDCAITLNGIVKLENCKLSSYSLDKTCNYDTKAICN